MESWRYLIWLKRLLPVLILFFIWLSYNLYTGIREQERKDIDYKHARVMAQVWFASARFRYEPNKYLAFRDSVLKANGLTNQQMFAYLENRRNKPENYYPFTVMVNKIADSLYRVEDSLRKVAEARLQKGSLTEDTLVSESLRR